VASEWKVTTASESELETILQNLDDEEFEIREIFPAQDAMKARFVVVGRRKLPEGRRRRRYLAQAVSIRCANGRYLRWQELSQPLRADSHHVGTHETFLMVRLEERYGEEVAAYRASTDLWVSMPNEAFSGPATLFRPDIGSWQMFSALPRDDGKLVLRTFRLVDGSHKFLGIDSEDRLEARAVPIDKAETFVIGPISGSKPEHVGVTLHF
jgi:hypothetical protein